MINYDMLPEHCRGGMRLYIEDGLIPGDFLQAVIRDSLVDALGRADRINSERIRDYALFMHNEAPMPCWRSKEKMTAWSRKGGLNGLEAEKKKEGVMEGRYKGDEIGDEGGDEG